MNKYVKKKYDLITSVKFIVPSLLGVILFMFPVKLEDKVTIPIALLSEFIQEKCFSYLPLMVLCLMGVSFLGSAITFLVFHFSKSKAIAKRKSNSIFCSLFQISLVSIAIRGFSFLLCIITYFKIGTKVVYSENTGGLVFYELLPILFTIFFLAGFLLPLLLNFGLLEFAGTLLIKVMRPLFNLPGRAAIDAIASWLGDGTIGVLLTSKQYEEGFYTEREACVIGTSFSLVSITFCLVIINTVGLSHMFVPFYLTVSFACLVAAIVIPKLPPLSRKKDCYVDGRKGEVKTEEVKAEEGVSFDEKNLLGDRKGQKSLSIAYHKALETVEGKKVIKSVLADGVSNVLNMWVGVIPIVMAMGTTALVVAEYTPVFEILGKPLLPFIKMLGIPEAVAVSKTLFAGFADMLLPSVMISNVANDMTRFIVAAVSVTQLIYLSEVGALLIASKIPVKFGELFLIFIERTLITLPIITLIAHILF